MSSFDPPMAGPAGTAPSSPRAEPRTAPRRLAADRLARILVSAGGLGIVASILGILAFILVEIWPLTWQAAVSPGIDLALPGPAVEALAVDEYRSIVVALAADGGLRVMRAADGAVVEARALIPVGSAEGGEPGVPVAGPETQDIVALEGSPDGRLLSAVLADGRVVAVPVSWRVTFEGDERRVAAELGEPIEFELGSASPPTGVFAVNLDEDLSATAVALAGDGSLIRVERSARENLLTGEITERFRSSRLATPVLPTVLALDRAQRRLYGGTARGELVWWDLSQSEGAPQVVAAGAAAVSALSLLIGDRSLAVGRSDGGLSIWFPVRDAQGDFRLTRIRDFPALPGPIERLTPSMRNKGFMAYGGGLAGLYHSTSARVLWTGAPPVADPRALLLAPRADAVFFAAPGRLASLAIRNPHPEISLRALFGRVWYEGYEGPEHVWQSTGGTDDFEPKLSLTPLLVGTLKGTFYSLLLAIPLGVLGAMYTSQFMHPAYQRLVKPTVEIMAALPTVVLGFLAGLWLAPRLESAFPSLLLMVVVLPAVVVAAGWGWSRVPTGIRGRFRSGIEGILFTVVLAFGIWLCIELSPAAEAWLFGGSFPTWLREATGLTYDQRNAVVVGLAMGFAVIPIIFAISEDAFSNVPQNLVAGSLALGADRWQTVTRIVLPTASPGIFSAVMVGFGRAVGETMIVLMATGNTPIMDWSPFNGFRTLSANIAVEIPEAPVGGTLYRTLFLAALVLFVLTFLVNTAAELVRQRLRSRYSRL